MPVALRKVSSRSSPIWVTRQSITGSSTLALDIGPRGEVDAESPTRGMIVITMCQTQPTAEAGTIGMAGLPLRTMS